MSFLESLLWLTLNVYHESRGEPEIGQLAVAHVTLNRAIEDKKTIADVVFAPRQFSWTAQKNSLLPLEINPLQDSLNVALKAMTTPDFTKGSTFYHRVDVDPKWKAHKSFIAQYGLHKFYRHNDTPDSASAF
jgi:N-acetylmuramoyl-L-alanine amidase